MRDFCFVNVVWGASYTDMFLEVSLPSTLSQGNLGTFAGKTNACYKIFTTTQDARRMESTPIFGRLRETLTTEIIPIDDICPADPPHTRLSECHRIALKSVEGSGTAVVFLLADMIISEGSLSSLLKLASNGKKVVMIAGLTTTREIAPIALESFYSEQEGVMAAPSRDLVNLSLNYLHPWVQGCIWGADSLFPFTSHLYWPISGEGLLVRGFHLYPLMVVADRKTPRFESTIDDDLIPKMRLHSKEIHIVEDSDEILVVAMNPRDQYPQDIFVREPSSYRRLYHAARFYYLYGNRQQFRFLEHKIRLLGKNASLAWQKAAHESDRILETALMLSILFPVVEFGRIAWKVTKALPAALSLPPKEFFRLARKGLSILRARKYSRTRSPNSLSYAAFLRVALPALFRISRMS